MKMRFVVPEWRKSPTATICSPSGPEPSGSHAVRPTTRLSKPDPIGCHAAPSHHATRLTVVVPEVVQLPPATSRGGNGPLPSGSYTANAVVSPLTKPLPSGCHAAPSHQATRLTTVPLGVVAKFPPATRRAGSGPGPSGSQTTSE